ncbi:MAG: hypothetical protein WCL51_18000 [Bacteroidota bacterium]
MKIIKNYILIIFFIISNLTFGQDWNMWSFKYKFKINTSHTIRYKYKNFEIFVNDSYSHEMYQGCEVKLDSISKNYTLKLNYGCISCGYTNSNRPPEIYLKINMDNDPYEKPFSTIIPIYFQKSESWENIEDQKDIVINIGTIEIENFLTDYYWKDKVETYEVIEVFPQNIIKYRKKGEYTIRRMNRIIKVE